MKVLVVDDSKFSRKRVVTALSNLDCEIIQACDGAEGIEAFHKEQPDLVISDLLMPNVDGIEQLKMIRATGSQTPVIIISADIQESSREMCNELGIVSFLNKPFKPNELQEAVHAAMSQKEPEHNNEVIA